MGASKPASFGLMLLIELQLTIFCKVVIEFSAATRWALVAGFEPADPVGACGGF
jgi:hypothetical protein